MKSTLLERKFSLEKEEITIEQLTILLIVMLLLLLIIILLPDKGNSLKILSPQFGFVACFIPGVIYAYQYIDKWNLILAWPTVFFIIYGLLVFVLFSYITSYVYDELTLSKNVLFYNRIQYNNINYKIENWKIKFLVFLELLSLLLTIIFLVKNYGANLSQAIFTYRSSVSNGLTSDNTLPSFVKVLRRIALSSGYIVMYLLLNGIVYKINRNRFWEYICVILAILNGFMLGGRGDGIQLIIAALVQYIALRYSSKNSKGIPIKSILIATFVIILLFCSFIQLGELLGRQMDFLNFNDYIGVYMSAELKNFDIFVNSGQIGHPISQSLTLYNIINSLGGILSIPSWIHPFDIPYRYYGNYALGNVGTIFYPFVYDAGLLGVILYTMVMAILCQVLYKKFLVSNKFCDISISFIFYSYMFYIIIFSFFSNKFYEMIFNTAFLWTFVSWIIVKFFLLNVKYNNNLN